MSRCLKIAVLRDRYPSSFNMPKNSRHLIRAVPFLPTNKISRHLEGLTIALPGNVDLAYYHNRIPALGRTPFIMSFESHLPRYFWGERTALFQFMRRRLAGERCRRIIAMSRFAQNIFLKQHAGTPEYERLTGKLEVVYPNIVLPEHRLEPRPQALPLKLAFVGAHFGRKGGAVAARAAEIARERKLPLHVHIVSSLQTGHGVWTDPLQEDFFAPYVKLLDAENVTFDRGLPNARVLEVLRDADFSILATFSDTFGYSAIESLAAGTPVIATPQGALPEFVAHEKNGLMLALDLDSNGEWKQIGRSDKASPAYAGMMRAEIDRLAQETIGAITPYYENPRLLTPLRKEARRTAERMFDSVKATAYLDDLYERCAPR